MLIGLMRDWFPMPGAAVYRDDVMLVPAPEGIGNLGDGIEGSNRNAVDSNVLQVSI
jgi:hypothetical protein